MTDLNDLNWDTILNYIDSEQAALFIGPDIIQFEGKPLNRALRDNLRERFKDKIAHYHRQEGLFLFKGKIAKNEAAQYVRKYLDEHQPDETIFRKIARIKFPLVISINPDTYLSDICYKYGIRHRFSYFKSKDKASEDIEEPSKDLPLLYNLCGSKNEDESIILDYEDLFRLVSSSISAPGLPDKLKSSLEKVRLFIFVGFHFENWSTQLMLRLLCGKDESQKYAANTLSVDENTRDFLMHQFQIEFLEKDQLFIDALFDQCGQHQLLRDISDPASSDSIDIIRQIQIGKDLFKAFEMLRQKTMATPLYDEVTLLMSTYNTLLEEKKKGVLDSRDYFVQFNRTVDGLLSILRKAT